MAPLSVYVYGECITNFVILFCIYIFTLTSFVLSCKLYKFSTDSYQIDLTVYFFLTYKSHIITSHLNSGNSSEGSIPIPILTVLQIPWVIFRVNLVNLPTYWTNRLFGKNPCFIKFFSGKTVCFLVEVLSPCILATILVFYCCWNCYNLSSYK